MIEIRTTKSEEIVDITPQVEAAVSGSGVTEGICHVYTMHTTTGIVINEAEGGLIQDLLIQLGSLVPRGGRYLHNRSDHNAHAHIQAALLGNSAVIPINGESLVMGTWQRVLFIELDGPRTRNIYVMAISR